MPSSSNRRAQAISWHDFVTGQLRGRAQKEVVNGQVSLLPETLTRSGP
ncbi:RepR protein [Lacticaseibacillus paracasei]|uniref:RepR protein n=1 Tax=Lacticaseibacillus paracasei subsp. paracasei Lpp14 TaxID=1256204 RepID=A0A829GJB3_LACPA|nr:RepR protein [Lacticaseibacillus paracasei]EPC28794.1 plasmid replication protein [Lacticaseibacillus paracasei subsp. paracasei Lpp46]EPC57476.1 RepR protein [Lacticaseibacillus paracasei subsp. paracasei Lpp14]